jgi:ABC-type multidrug transport system ATPase subunit
MIDPEIAIQVHGLSKDFGNRSVLRRIDLEVPAGQCLVLTGANGAGKTTLLRCLAAAIRPTAGAIHWFGQPITAGFGLRRQIGMVAHENRLYPHLTLHENLVFAARLCGVPDPEPRAAEWLRRVDLAACAHYLPTQASKGMRQRVALARAVIHEPRILLLDEPFSGLDQQGSRWLLETLRDLHAAGRTICFSTHDEGHARRLADRICELRAGRLGEVAFPDKAGVVRDHTWSRAA